MGKEREPIAWVTKGGKHIPIFADEPTEDEKKKDRQIAQNKKEANKLNSKKDDGIRHMTAEEFDKEAKRQGLDLTSDDIEEYVTSSYGGIGLGDKISKFVDNAPDSMKVQSSKLAYRGLQFKSKKELDNFINNHSEGKVVESRRDGLSWTMNENVAKEFSVNSSKQSLILVNEDEFRNAVSIKGFADTPGVSSEEILYSSSTDFEVIDVEKKNGLTYMWVTEAPIQRRKYK